MNASSSIDIESGRRTEQMGGPPRHDLVAGEMTCPSCGGIIKRAVVVCVHCGIPTSSDPFGRRPAIPYGRKRKRVAILLALSLGYWAWLYTIAVDWWRFVVCLIVQILLVGFTITLALAVGIDSEDATVWNAVVAFLLVAVCWLWPIIHTGRRRPQFFYHEYPQAE